MNNKNWRPLVGAGALILGVAAVVGVPALLRREPEVEAATKRSTKTRRSTTRRVTPQVAPASKSLGTMKGMAGLGKVVYVRQKADQDVNEDGADFNTHVRLLDVASKVASKQDTAVVSSLIPPIRDAEHPAVTYKEPALSPDGSRVAVVRESAYYGDESDLHQTVDIWVMEADGSNPTRLTSTEDDETQPRWSPDGSLIAYTRRLSSGDSAVRIMNADGSGNRLLLGGQKSQDAAWSPDGKRLALVTISGLGVVNADGSGLRTLPEVAGRLNRDTPQHPSWSPDGQWIAFELSQAYEPPDATGADSLTLYSSIYAVRADARGTRRSSRPILLAGSSTSDDARKATQNSYETPVWLPDGRIVFSWKQRSKYDGSTQKSHSDLWTMKADGSAKARLTNTPGFDEQTPDAR